MLRLANRICACLAVLTWAVHARPAAAQPISSVAAPAAEPSEYRTLIAAALEEYEAHNFAEARALFMQAHAAYPNARTLRGQGMAEFELKNYADSVRSLEAALEARARPLEGDLRVETEELLARARRFVARYTLQLKPPAPQGLRLTLDREPIAPGPGLTLMLPLGEHVLLVQAPGYLEERRTLTVKAAEQRTLPIELRRGSETAAQSVVPQPARSDDKPLRRNPWLWTGVAVAIAAGVVAGVIVALDQGDGANGRRPDASVATLLQAGR